MRRVTTAALLAAAMAAYTLGAAPAALAAPQQTRDIRSARRATAESIAAQYAAEQFRAAQIGDETTRQLLAQNDAQRRRIAAVLKDAKSTAAERDAAKAQLVELDSQLKDVNARLLASQATGDELRAQLREYQRQITDAVETASPEVAAAYELYAQGDRDTAYEVIDRLSQAEAAAAKRAGEIRAGALMRRPAALALDRKDRGEMTLAQVIGAWERAQAADPSWWRGWIDLGNLQLEAGRLADAKAAGEQAVKTAANNEEKASGLGMIGEALVAMGDPNGGRAKFDEAATLLTAITAPWGESTPTPEQVNTLRSLLAIYDRQGDLLSSELSYRSAAEVYGRELAICRRILAAMPEDIRAQRDLAVCLAKNGDAFVAAAQPAQARLAYEELLTIMRRVLATNPQNLVYRREASMAMLQNAEFLVGVGDRPRARALAAEGLALSRTQFAADPANATAKRDLSVALTINAAALEPGKATLKTFRELLDEAIVLRRELATAQPASAAAQRDLAMGYQTLAVGLAEREDMAGSAAAFREEIAAFKTVAALPTSDGHDKRRVGLALTDLGRLTERVSGAEAAKPVWEEALAIQRKLVEQNADSSLVHADLGRTLATLGDYRFDARDYAAAKVHYDEALVMTAKAFEIDPGNNDAFREAGLLFLNIGDTAYELRDFEGVETNYAKALNVYEQLKKAEPQNGSAAFDYARAVYKWAQMTENAEIYGEAVTLLEAADRLTPLGADGKRYLATARERAKAAPPPPATTAPAAPAAASPAPASQGHD